MNQPEIPTGESARTSDSASQGASTEPLKDSPPVYGDPGEPMQGRPQGYGPAETRQMGTAPDYAYPPPPMPDDLSGPPTVPSLTTASSTVAMDTKDKHRHRGAPIVGPVILIGAGTVFLLNNLDVLPWSVWNQLWRLWPLILIAIGLDLLVGRRNTWLSLLLVLLIVGFGVAFLANNGNLQPLGGVTTSTLSIPKGSAESAQVTLNLGTGNLDLDGAAGSESLATGTLEYFQNRSAPEQSSNTVDGKAVLTLRQREESGFDIANWFGSGHGVEWNVHLNPAVPMEVTADLGTGNSTLDLSQLKVTDVNVDSGAGNTTVVFPRNAGSVTGKIDGGVGNLNLKVPDGVEARIDASSGIGNINTDNRFTKQGEHIYTTSGYDKATNKLDLKLDVGVGNVEISR